MKTLFILTGVVFFACGIAAGCAHDMIGEACFFLSAAWMLDDAIKPRVYRILFALIITLIGAGVVMLLTALLNFR